jgi:hypothetical protein
MFGYSGVDIYGILTTVISVQLFIPAGHHCFTAMLTGYFLQSEWTNTVNKFFRGGDQFAVITVPSFKVTN